MTEIFRRIEMERKAQDKKWGKQNHSPIEWSVILTEECGEVAKEALEHRFGIDPRAASGLTEVAAERRALFRYEEELIQVAAVAVAMIESLWRNELRASYYKKPKPL